MKSRSQRWFYKQQTIIYIKILYVTQTLSSSSFSLTLCISWMSYIIKRLCDSLQQKSSSTTDQFPIHPPAGAAACWTNDRLHTGTSSSSCEDGCRSKREDESVPSEGALKKSTSHANLHFSIHWMSIRRSLVLSIYSSLSWTNRPSQSDTPGICWWKCQLGFDPQRRKDKRRWSWFVSAQIWSGCCVR